MSTAWDQINKWLHFLFLYFGISRQNLNQTKLNNNIVPRLFVLLFYVCDPPKSDLMAAVTKRSLKNVNFIPGNLIICYFF